MNKIFFISGTDTNVGKTFITCALIELLRKKHKNRIVAGMKPVAAGESLCNGIMINPDVYKIHSSNNAKFSIKEINSYSYKEAIAPHIAAKINNRPISLDKIKADFDFLKNKTDYLFVEGAGGYHVPLSETTTTSDLINLLNIPIILVVAIRLGCLNHTMLTIESIRNKNQKIFGWVANVLDPNMPFMKENIQYLKNKIVEPCFGEVPFIGDNNPLGAYEYLIWPSD